MIAWNKLVVGGAISLAAIGGTSAYAYACGHRPPSHHWPHRTTTTKPSTTSTAPSTTTSTTTSTTMPTTTSTGVG